AFRMPALGRNCDAARRPDPRLGLPTRVAQISDAARRRAAHRSAHRVAGLSARLRFFGGAREEAPGLTPHALFGDRLVRVEGERALIGFTRLGAIAGAVVGEAEPSPGHWILGVDVQRRVEVFDRLVILAEVDEALAARLIGRRREGIAVDRIVEIADRALIVA